MDNIIGLRREDLSKKGEKRVAITPEFAEQIIGKGHRIIVQPGIHPVTGTVKRTFSDQEYAAAGAEISEDLAQANVILGIKEIEKDQIAEGKTYIFFSHTHKGQAKNRKMLRTLCEKKATLIDYELITNPARQRLVTAFTYFAGYAGMVDTLWLYGKRLAAEGILHPFHSIPQSIEKEDLSLISDLVRKAGERIAAEGTPANLPPLINCILGTGKTSVGVQKIFDLLPVQLIGPEEAPEVFKNGRRDQVYKMVLDIHQIYRLHENAGISPETYQAMSTQEKWNHYFENPGDFESNLEGILPYTSILMNCILWSPKYPRHLSEGLMADIWARTRTLQAIGDISCDPGGSIEFSRESWIDDPVYIYKPETREFRQGFDGEGVAVLSVVNLPCEFSSDASDKFCRDLAPMIWSILDADFQNSIENSGLCDEIKGATILWKGEFTPKYEYMKAYLQDSSSH